MRIGRTLPPAASPIPFMDIIRALPTCFNQNSAQDRFIHEIKKEFNTKHCFLLSSGKTALTLILLALKELYPDRNQVVIPAFTCFSVPAAIKRAGLKIKLCDLAPSSFDFDTKSFKKLVTEDKQTRKILCILPTHLFGCPSNVCGIKDITGTGIPIVEDAAQAMGATANKKKLGTCGDVGFFSLGRGKALSTMKGGIIITERDDLAEIFKSLTVSLPEHNSLFFSKEFFKTISTTTLQFPSLFWLPKALPFLKLGKTFYEPNFSMGKLPTFYINLAKKWQKRLERHQQLRSSNIAYWQKKLPEIILHPCGKINNYMIRFPMLAPSRELRDYIVNQSEQKGLGIMRTYPTPIHKIPELAKELSNLKYTEAEKICDRLLTIPVHEYVRNTDNEKIVKLLLNCE